MSYEVIDVGSSTGETGEPYSLGPEFQRPDLTPEDFDALKQQFFLRIGDQVHFLPYAHHSEFDRRTSTLEKIAVRFDDEGDREVVSLVSPNRGPDQIGFPYEAISWVLKDGAVLVERHAFHRLPGEALDITSRRRPATFEEAERVPAKVKSATARTRNELAARQSKRAATSLDADPQERIPA